MIEGYKVFTHDLRSPIHVGEPVWDGTVPFDLPKVELDESNEECGAGWNFCRSASDALRIAGLWPNGRPSRLFRVETESAIERGNKCRSATIRITSEITDFRPAIAELSQPFGDFVSEMISEQLAWREALARPLNDKSAIESGLKEALSARGLDWKLKQFKCSWDARDAWDAWAARAARAAWDAWAARDGLTVFYSSKKEYIDIPANFLTVGIRDAYKNGLLIAIPTEPCELGWAMEER